jgi:hypothetical protein
VDVPRRLAASHSNRTVGMRVQSLVPIIDHDMEEEEEDHHHELSISVDETGGWTGFLAPSFDWRTISLRRQ